VERFLALSRASRDDLLPSELLAYVESASSATIPVAAGEAGASRPVPASSDHTYRPVISVPVHANGASNGARRTNGSNGHALTSDGRRVVSGPASRAKGSGKADATQGALAGHYAVPQALVGAESDLTASADRR
jgi:hypothetical protein